MHALNRIRNYSFWFIDFLKGGNIRNHYKEIEALILQPNSLNSVEKRKNNLNNLLKHATSSTEYYKPYANYKSINDFPVIKKTVIQSNFEAFNSEKYLKAKNYKVSTSGSTGLPFFLFQNSNKRSRNTADVLFFAKLSSYTIGNKLFELEVWRKHNQKSKLKSFIQNVTQFDISKLTDAHISVLIEKLKSSKQTKTILGFSSALENICRYLDESNTSVSNLNINSILANSEYLNSYTKENLGKHFNAPVLSRYSSEEIGIVAHQTIDSQEHFIVNNASYYIELLKFDEDTPAEAGEHGRIVVTDLFNYSMPIIRYDTGDIAKMLKTNDGTLKFESIEGRRMDLIYDTQGNLISSFVVYTNFYPFYSLLNQYQFIQTAQKDYLVKLNIKHEFVHEKDLIISLKKEFGNDANIKIEYVDEIPPLASGKRKKVVNLWSA
ncbi:CoF synthetase [Algibacter mikhailovii]|uniref:CoF synthetase n=1 Tax=Algibacter mikhailovii TaxID=425498 RepID=UPI00249409BF|nr:CoF synthetase [Algibacter mikhailovii]